MNNVDSDQPIYSSASLNVIYILVHHNLKIIRMCMMNACGVCRQNSRINVLLAASSWLQWRKFPVNLLNSVSSCQRINPVIQGTTLFCCNNWADFTIQTWWLLWRCFAGYWLCCLGNLDYVSSASAVFTKNFCGHSPFGLPGSPNQFSVAPKCTSIRFATILE